MAKKLCLLMALCLLLTLTPYGSAPAAASNYSVVDPQVLLSDNVIDRNVSCYIRFKAGRTLLGGRDTITVRFPEAFQLDTIRPVNVSVNNRSVSGLDYSGHLLSVLIPDSLNVLTGDIVELGIASAVFQNPREAGLYQFSLKTSGDTSEVATASFSITDYEYANGVSKPTALVSTSAEGVSPAYRVTFKTSVNGRLPEGSKIYLTFPAGATMPSYIEGRYVTVNNYPLTGQTIFVDGRKITLTIPTGLTIAAAQSVTIDLTEGAGIKNPPASNYHTLIVATSAEPTQVTSFPLETRSAISTTVQETEGVKVLVSPAGAGQNAAYTITVKAGKLYPLTNTITDFVLTFPRGTVIPATVPAESIKVNQTAVKGTLVNTAKSEMIFILGQDLPGADQIVIDINQSAGIKNPPPAQYKMDLGVVRATASVLSDFYVIQNAPATADPVTTPATPATDPAPVSGKIIVFRLDSLVVDVDGTYSLLDTAPTMINNTTFVPLRFIATVLGATADHNEAANTVTVKYNEKEILLWVNSTTARVNGNYVTLSAPATIVNGRVMVPVRFIGESFGAGVLWDESTQKITINRDGTTAAPSVSTPPAQGPVGSKVSIKAGNSYVNLRTGPSTDYAITGRLLVGETATVIGVSDTWYQVRQAGGSEAWVASWMVDLQ